MAKHAASDQIRNDKYENFDSVHNFSVSIRNPTFQTSRELLIINMRYTIDTTYDLEYVKWKIRSLAS